MPLPVEELRKRLGRLPSPPDPKDHRLVQYVPRLAEVTADLPRSRVPYTPTLPLYNQGATPTCVGHSRALSSTIDQRKDHRRTIWYDAHELYARSKERDGIPHIDGTYPRVALQIAKERGVKILRSPRASEVGQFDQIGAYAALASVQEIKAAIYLFGSVGLGSTWYENWFDIPPDKTLPQGLGSAGGHAYTAIGWSDYRKALLIQNSWGADWGWKIGGLMGRAWLPYAQVDFNDFEAWRSIDIQNQ